MSKQIDEAAVREKFKEGFKTLRGPMSEIARRVQAGREIPQDFDGEELVKLVALGIMRSVIVRGKPNRYELCDGFQELFADDELVSSSRRSTPPSGRVMCQIDDDPTEVIPPRSMQRMAKDTFADLG
ncbi:hypothetical protein IT411_04240 [Candidatus Peregrinibacteria bacterium]|nr:hypothetical protein [Candidatus Peregrinibacteria bacterium]